MDLLLVVVDIGTAMMIAVAVMDLAEMTSEEVRDTTMTSTADHVVMVAAAADAIETTITVDAAALIDTKEVAVTTPMLAPTALERVAATVVVTVAAMHMVHPASAVVVAVAEALVTTTVMIVGTALLPHAMSLLVKPTVVVVVVVATMAEKTAMLQDRLLPTSPSLTQRY